jgi:hypothetical protein
MKGSRTNKLLSLGLHGRFVLLALCAAGLGVALHVALTAWVLSALAAELPHDGGRVFEEMPTVLATTFLLTIVLCVPVLVLVSVTATRRTLAPLKSLRRFMTDVLRGFQVEPLRLRKGDQLQGLCKLLNRVTEPTREANSRLATGVGSEPGAMQDEAA